jgi:hypothetical protein
METPVRAFFSVAVPLAMCSVAACGNDSSAGTDAVGQYPGGNTITPVGAENVAPVTIDAGPSAAGGYLNGIFVNVTVCVPGTSSCQTIDHILLDTGSTGLRLLSSSQGGELTLQLPAVTDAGGNPAAECTQFLDGFTWGPVELADLKMGGETASRISIQVIDEKTYGVPSTCRNIGQDEDTIAVLGANGIIGVGLFIYDCGIVCAPGSGSQNPGQYYSCNPTSRACSTGALALASQVTNPVAHFANDNNGTIIELPVIASAGTTQASGSLVFGIDTRANNQLGDSTQVSANSCGYFTTTYAGIPYPNSFIDSGSNALFYLDTSLVASAGITACSGNASFYCTSSATTTPVTQTATTAALSSQSGSVVFGIADANALFNSSNVAFDDVGGPMATSYSCSTGAVSGPAFDWGLPFFFGRNVYTSLESPSALGTGFYFAYN